MLFVLSFGGLWWQGVSVRQRGGDRAGETRITQFLYNPKVSVDEMVP